MNVKKISWYVIGTVSCFLASVLLAFGTILLFISKGPIFCFGFLEKRGSCKEIGWKRWLARAGFVPFLFLSPIWLPLMLFALALPLGGLFIMVAANELSEWLFPGLYHLAWQEELNRIPRTNLSAFFPLID